VGRGFPARTVLAKPLTSTRFELRYQDVLVGTLTFADGKWTFGYSDEFRDSTLRTIAEFPDRKKTYVSETLWPFFFMRIPSMKRASIREIVEQEHLDEGNTPELLRRFGKRSVSNPFVLNSL